MGDKKINSSRYELLNLSPSDNDSSDHVVANANNSNSVPDLDLPSAGAAGLQSGNGIQQRIKRKIRLKRRDRDRLGGALSSSSASFHGMEEASSGDEFVGNCCRGRGNAARGSSSSGTSILMLSGFSFVLVLIGFLFMIRLQTQQASFESRLETALEQRDDLMDKYHSMHVQLNDLASNQSLLKTNVSSIFDTIASLSDQFHHLNTTLTNLSGTLTSTPDIKKLPTEVDGLKKSIAQFGSRMTEVEAKLTSKDRENKRQSTLEERSSEKYSILINSLANTTERLKAEITSLDDRLTMMGTSLEEEIQSTINKTTKNLEMIGTINRKLSELTQQVENSTKRIKTKP